MFEEALYRKYRPHDFHEVVGQTDVLALLEKVSADKKPSHAYLFSGGRGVGKTSLARIFAKRLGISPEDIYELDAASNRGIDEVRELRDSVHTLPLSSPYKMYILDEAHMLTKEAANALLKTLEEPPAHVIFVLATTEKEKLPDTIHSRCQLLSFREPDVATLSKHLAFVASKEGFTLSPDASHVVARAGKGSFRDALGALEKVLRTSSSKDIALSEARKILGETEEELLRAVIVAVYRTDVAALEKTLGQLRAERVSPVLFYTELLETLRTLLLARVSQQSLSKDTLQKFSTLSLEKPVLSKHILFLLEKMPLLSGRDDISYLALFTVLAELSEQVRA